MSLELKERQVGRVTLLELVGRLTMGEAGEALEAKVESLIAAGRLALLLDCSKVIAIDSQGIKAIIRAVTSVEQRGGKLKLLSLSPRVREVLKITRLLTVLETFDTEAAAIASFSPLRPPTANAAAGREVRRSRRVPLTTQVQSLSAQGTSLGRTQNLSEGGLFMLSPDTFKPETEITVRFHLPPIPPGRPIEGRGVVVHAKHGVNMGIGFLSLEDQDRKAIAEFVQHAA